jgi:hypothetical protein
VTLPLVFLLGTAIIKIRASASIVHSSGIHARTKCQIFIMIEDQNFANKKVEMNLADIQTRTKYVYLELKAGGYANS